MHANAKTAANCHWGIKHCPEGIFVTHTCQVTSTKAVSVLISISKAASETICIITINRKSLVEHLTA